MNGIRVSLLVIMMLSIGRAETISAVRGTIESDRPFVASGLFVELERMGSVEPRVEAPVVGDGSFEFRQVSLGTYRLRVNNSMGRAVCVQIVQIAYERPLVIRLPDSTPSAGGDSVSAWRLMRPVPKKALHEMVEADRSAKTGRPAEAAQHLERAIEIFPDYFEARCNLGVQYMRLGRGEEAAQQFEKAIASGPPSAIAHGNLAYARYVAGRLDEAEQSARHALNVDSSFRLAHYVLGLVLVKTVTPGSLKNAREAAEHLRLAAEITPSAHLQMAKIYQAENDPVRAQEELRLYLGSGDTAYKTQAQSWLSSFRK